MAIHWKRSADSIARQISNLGSELYELNKHVREQDKPNIADKLDEWSVQAETISEEIQALRKDAPEDEDISNPAPEEGGPDKLEPICLHCAARSETCDEDGCCETCGADIVFVADYSTHLVLEHAQDKRDSSDALDGALSNVEKLTRQLTEVRLETDKVEQEHNTEHDRIEGALAAALGNPPMSIHDGDGPTADSLEGLIALVSAQRQQLQAYARLRSHLTAKMADQPELWYLLGGSMMTPSKTMELLAATGLDLESWLRSVPGRSDSEEAYALARHGARLLEVAYDAIGPDALDQLSVSGLPVAVL